MVGRQAERGREPLGDLHDQQAVRILAGPAQLTDRAPGMERQAAPALAGGRGSHRRHHPRALLLQQRGEPAEVGRGEADVRAALAERALDRAEEAREVVHARVVEERGADQQQGAVDAEVLPVVPFAQRREERRGLAGAQRASQGCRAAAGAAPHPRASRQACADPIRRWRGRAAGRDRREQSAASRGGPASGEVLADAPGARRGRVRGGTGAEPGGAEPGCSSAAALPRPPPAGGARGEQGGARLRAVAGHLGRGRELGRLDPGELVLGAERAKGSGGAGRGGRRDQEPTTRIPNTTSGPGRIRLRRADVGGRCGPPAPPARARGRGAPPRSPRGWPPRRSQRRLRGRGRRRRRRVERDPADAGRSRPPPRSARRCRAP